MSGQGWEFMGRTLVKAGAFRAPVPEVWRQESD